MGRRQLMTIAGFGVLAAVIRTANAEAAPPAPPGEMLVNRVRVF
jgi:hypothetical protein